MVNSNGKPDFKMDDLGGTIIFGNIQMDQQSRLSRDRFLSSKLDAFCEADLFFCTKTPKSPSTQLPLVVIVGESYPVVGE